MANPSKSFVLGDTPLRSRIRRTCQRFGTGSIALATRAADALSDLGHCAKSTSTMSPPAITEPPLSSESGTETVDSSLQSFCEAVLALMRLGPDGSSVLMQTMPSLPRIFSACNRIVLAQLRAELNVSRTTAEQLMQFVGAHHGNAAHHLQERVHEARRSVSSG